MERIPEPELMDIPERAEAYARADFSAVNAAFVEKLLTLAANRDKCLALDLGTGPGDIPLRIQALKPGWRIAAADASLPMLQLARAAANQHHHQRSPLFILADAKRLPLADQSIDVIFSNSILHHLTDPLPFWREIRRLAAPGALVFVRDLFRPHTADDAKRFVDAYAANEHHLLREDFFNSFLAAFTSEEIREQIDAASLASLEVAPASDRHVDIFGILRA